jgi:hypothetical protein
VPTWSEDEGLDALRREISSQLPAVTRTLSNSEASYPGESDWYVHDIGIAGQWALLCSYSGGDTRWAVADIAWDTGSPVLASKSAWTEVEQQFVSKVAAAQAFRHAGLTPDEAARLLEIELEDGTALTRPAEDPNAPRTDSILPVLEYEYLSKATTPEHRYTFGPLYAPDLLDAHGEYTDAETLQLAQWDYVRLSASSGRRLNLQHGDMGDVTVGEWVDIVSWPLPSEVTVTVPGTEETKKVSLPAGTTYMGVIWDEAAWPLVKQGKIGGLSLGGRAVRVKEAAELIPTSSMGG